MIFGSLGQLLMMGRDLNDMSQVIAVMMLIIAIWLHRRWLGVQDHQTPPAAQVGAITGLTDVRFIRSEFCGVKYATPSESKTTGASTK
jgi:hypothetical protein